MNPKLKMRLFVAPKNLAPLKAIVIRELDAEDQRFAAREANMRKALDDDEAMEVRGQETLRMAIHAVQYEGDDEPQVVDQPFADLDSWSIPKVRFLQECFGYVNLLDPREVGEALAQSVEWTADRATTVKRGPGAGSRAAR